MTHRALSLLGLTTPSLILDVGCGSGLSGEILTDPSSHPTSRYTGPEAESEAESDADMSDSDASGANTNANADVDVAQTGGKEAHTHAKSLSHEWIGIDISPSMLSVASFERAVTGDLFLSDMGQGLPFRPGTFDGCISISAIQWLCSSPSSLDSEQPARRLKRFFDALFVALKRGARAVCQFYPRDRSQRNMIAKAAMSAGFGTGLLVDDEGTKGGKTYLVCSVGGGDITGVVRGLGVDVEDGRRGRGGAGGRGNAGEGNVKQSGKGSKEWILRKKDQAERRGKVVKADSRYTGRKRKTKF